MTCGVLTRSNNHKNPTLEKLDMVLVSGGWEDIFPLAIVKKVVRNCSDNNLVILSLENNQVTSPASFNERASSVSMFCVFVNNT
jgi:hypothetical protein